MFWYKRHECVMIHNKIKKIKKKILLFSKEAEIKDILNVTVLLQNMFCCAEAELNQKIQQERKR